MADFDTAVDNMNNKVKKGSMSDDEMKEIYGLYKQAMIGDVNTDRPGMLDLKTLKGWLGVLEACVFPLRASLKEIKGKAKWDAWNSKKGMSQEEAKQKYVAYAAEMLAKHGN